MSANDANLATIRKIYEAFGRGDVPAILEHISPEVHWEFGTPDHGIPWLVQGRGREGVLSFFQAVGAELAFERFEVLAVMGEGEWVVGLIHLEAVAKRTGKRFREECEAHIWRFDPQGRVIGMRHAADTATHLAALS